MKSPYKIFLCVCLCLCGNAHLFSSEPVSYRLAPQQGRLVITGSDGHTVPWTAYSSSVEQTMEIWSKRQAPFLEAKAQVYQICIWGEKSFFDQPFWSLDGKPVLEPHGKMTLGEQAEWLLKQTPDAHFLVRFGAWPSPDWRNANRDECMPVPHKIWPYNDGFSANPSLASKKYLTGLAQLIGDLVAWCEKQPWRNRIIGYCVFPYGEGATEVPIHGERFDNSLPMQHRFREYLQQKYTSDEALQKAWNAPKATIAASMPPTEEEWRTARKSGGWQHFPDPQATTRFRDYFACARLCFREYLQTMFEALQTATRARPCLKGYDLLKQHMQGWLLTPRFDANWTDTTWTEHGPVMFASGAFGLADLLDHPGLDLLHTPGVYYNRAVGYAWEAEGLSDSLVLRGKLNYMEGDMRTWVNLNYKGMPKKGEMADAGTFRTIQEVRAGFDRAFAWAVSRNQMFYFMNVSCNNWWYYEPTIQTEIARTHQQVTKSITQPWTETRDAICVVLDDGSPMWEDFTSGYQHIAVRRQIEEGLSLCGIPYRIHLLEDLARANFPQYKCYLFPNLFEISEKTERLLHEKVLRDGNVVILGPATGIIRDGKQTTDPISRLLGVPMELVKKSCPRRTLLRDFGHPLSRSLPTTTFGADYAFGPLLVPKAVRFDPAKQEPTELGSTFMYYFFERPGLFIKDFGTGARAKPSTNAKGKNDYAILFSSSIPLPAELLRAAGTYAGCEIRTEENAVVYASRNFVGVHAIKGGTCRLHIPSGMAAQDYATGKRLPQENNVVELTITPPQTILLRLVAK